MLSGAAGTLVLRCAAGAFTFLLTVILGRRLGASGYGIYAWALAWASILQIVTVFGFDMLAIREFAAYRANGAWSTMRGLLRTGPLLVFAGSGVVALFFIAAGFAFVGSAQRSTFVIAAAFVPILALTSACQGAIQGLGSVAVARLPNDLVAPALYVVLLVLAWQVLDLRRSAPVAMALQAGAALGALIVAALLLRRLLPAPVGQTPSSVMTGEWIGRAVPLGLVNALAIALAQIDVVLLGILSSSSQVGVYSTSARIANFVGIAELAVNAAYLPVVARLFATGRIDRLKTGAPMVTLAATLLSAFLAAPVIAFAPSVLGLFGGSFKSGALILQMLCLAFVISAAAGQNGAVLMMTGKTRRMVLCSASALAVNIALNVILIPLMDARGAAIAWLLTVIVWNGVLSWQVRRVFGFTATLVGLLSILRER